MIPFPFDEKHLSEDLVTEFIEVISDGYIRSEKRSTVKLTCYAENGANEELVTFQFSTHQSSVTIITEDKEFESIIATTFATWCEVGDESLIVTTEIIDGHQRVRFFVEE